MLSTEQKVGLFVVATLIVLGVGTFLVGDVRFFGEQDRVPYTARISDVKGLQEQASVRIAGVEVGEVTGIRLADGQARVRLRIQRDVRLPEGTVATIAGTGLVGEKYVTLSSPPGAEGRLGPGATIPEGEKAQDMDDVMRKFGQVGSDVKEVTESLREVLGGEEGKARLERILDNIDKVTAELEGMAAENREGLRQLVAKLNDTADNLSEISANIRDGEGTIGKLYKDEKVYDEVARVSENLQEITTKIRNGEGAIGKLVSDEEVGRDLEQAVSGIGEYAGSVQRIKTTVSMDTRYLTEQETSKTDLNVRLQTRPTRYYLLGITSDGLPTQARVADPGEPLFGQKGEFGDEIKFNFMFGRTWPNYGVSGRIGIQQSTGGLGLSYYPFRSLELAADLWDFGGGNSGDNFGGPQSRFLARYSFFEDHLFVEGGVHNAFSEEYRSPFFGAGLRFYDEDLKYVAGSVPTGM